MRVLNNEQKAWNIAVERHLYGLWREPVGTMIIFRSGQIWTKFTDTHWNREDGTRIHHDLDARLAELMALYEQPWSQHQPWALF